MQASFVIQLVRRDDSLSVSVKTPSLKEMLFKLVQSDLKGAIPCL